MNSQSAMTNKYKNEKHEDLIIIIIYLTTRFYDHKISLNKYMDQPHTSLAC